MTPIIMFCLLIETAVSALRHAAGRANRAVSPYDALAVLIGVALAVALRINLFGYLPVYDYWWDAPGWLDYAFFAMSGVSLGRGASLMYKLMHRPWRFTIRADKEAK